jgi:hypothetical protein
VTLAELVYVLCALTSLACAVLLLRGWRRTRARLLFWSGICFVGFFLNNALLLVQLPGMSMETQETWRIAPALLGAFALLYGLIMETDA